MEKKIILMLSVLVLVFSYLPSVASAPSHIDVTVSEAKEMMDSKPSLAILDVRNQSEYDFGHIRNAKLIPLYELEARLDELKKTDEILVYCRSGRRSATASELLVNNSFMHVYNMLGGILAWMDEGYPVYIKYSSIQEAINNANDGDTIYVSSGLYYEHLTINKPLTLVGENKDTTIIDGSISGHVVTVKADNVSINGFTIRGSGCGCAGYSGVYIESSQNLNITSNLIIQNDGYGIKLNGTHHSIIAQNNIRDNIDSGIKLSNSNNNAVFNNYLLNNHQGIYLDNSSDNDIFDNRVFDNTFGIYLQQSSNNMFFHNNFVGNGRQTYCYKSASVWDNGVEGNYWSNYTGVDSNQNGIGNTWYEINLNNVDHYPLMGLFSSFRTSLGPLVNVISNSTIEDFEYFQFNTTIRMHVSNMTVNQTFGFCRVCIPHALMNETYRVTMDGIEPYYVNYTIYDDGDSRWIYFLYEHSTFEIVIIPEFPSLIILTLFMMATLLAIIVYRGKHSIWLPYIHFSTFL